MNMLYRAFVAVVLFMLPAVAMAGEALTYEVSGVAANDVLNIRKGPSASTAKVGSYSPRDSGIYIVRRAGNWALVGRADHARPDGWVHMRYLKQTMAEAEVPLPLVCFGTEPFWSLSFEANGKAIYSDPENAETDYTTASVNRAGQGAGIAFGEKGAASITAESCNDGMSDNQFAYSVRVTMPDGRVLQGCCRKR